jgi:HEAT repeat protein
MDRLAERERISRDSVTAAPALALQFFVIPLAVVALTVLVYLGFRLMLTDTRSAQDYLTEIRTGGSNRRWPAAYELSRLLADPEVRLRDRTLAPGLVRAFEASKGDDPRVRRYLALALGRLDPPLPERASQLLIEALDDPDSETRISAIWALGSAGDASVIPHIQRQYDSPDPGIRKMAVYALGAVAGEAQRSTLRTALADPVPDVQWNAAVALARHGDGAGLPVLRRMLDRAYVARAVTAPSRPDQETDPVSEVMLSALRAVAALRESSLRETVTALSRADENLRVRQGAIEALRTMEGRVPGDADGRAHDK